LRPRLRARGALLALLVLAAPGALAPAPARAQMFYTEEREYYDIRGSTMAELRAEIARLGPGEFAPTCAPGWGRATSSGATAPVAG